MVSKYIGKCETPNPKAGEKPRDMKPAKCDGRFSKTWTSIDVRFMFRVTRGPPLYSKEFQAFLYESTDEKSKDRSKNPIIRMDRGEAMTFGAAWDKFTTLVVEKQTHNLLRVGPRADKKAQTVSFAGTSSAADIGYFPSKPSHGNVRASDIPAPCC